MTRALAGTLALALSACTYFQKPEPQIITRTDTVTITKEVAPPLPTGDTASICLSTGMTVQVLVNSTGDTLIGDARVKLSEVRSVLSFAGNYAADKSWYGRDTLRFETRLYRKFGMEKKRACDELKEVGAYQGVPVFAEVEAPGILPAIVLPVRPGKFQTYNAATTPRRR
jgi:hypothetical protein